MRFWMILSLTLSFSVCFWGCVSGSGSGDDVWQTPAYDNSASTIAEIDAVVDLKFDDARQRAFSNIACRPHISGRTQVYLVKQSMKSLRFDDSKRTVLLALVNNPYFVQEGKMAILDHLDALQFDSAKQQVLEAINARGLIPTERQFHINQQQRQEIEERKPLTTEIKGVEVQAYGDIRITAETSHLD